MPFPVAVRNGNVVARKCISFHAVDALFRRLRSVVCTKQATTAKNHHRVNNRCTAAYRNSMLKRHTV